MRVRNSVCNPSQRQNSALISDSVRGLFVINFKKSCINCFLLSSVHVTSEHDNHSSWTVLAEVDEC